jgi:hypothetical protein
MIMTRQHTDLGPAPAASIMMPSPLPPTATAFATKAKDLQALRDAVVDAATVGGGLWYSYLFVLLYLLITVGSITHRDLFLESRVKLPFLDVDLPLLGFFALGPAIFLIVHAYVLLHFVLLAGKVGYFNAELQAQIADKEVRWRLRRQLPSNIFVQSLSRIARRAHWPNGIYATANRADQPRHRPHRGACLLPPPVFWPTTMRQSAGGTALQS